MKQFCAEQREKGKGEEIASGKVPHGVQGLTRRDSNTPDAVTQVGMDSVYNFHDGVYTLSHSHPGMIRGKEKRDGGKIN